MIHVFQKLNYIDDIITFILRQLSIDNRFFLELYKQYLSIYLSVYWISLLIHRNNSRPQLERFINHGYVTVIDENQYLNTTVISLL